MACSGSLKELSRAINSSLPSAKYPLSDDLQEVIDAYVRKHEEYDDAAATRLQDEMLSIYHKQVKDTPDRLPTFVGILLHLFPIMRTQARYFQWWELLSEPVLKYEDTGRTLFPMAFAGFMDIMTSSQVETSSSNHEGSPNPFIERCLSAWMETYAQSPVQGSTIAQARERRLLDALVAFGKKSSKSFLTSLDKFFVRKEYRQRAVRLLREFLQNQPPHLHEILETPLFSNLLQCLQHDTSTTVVSVALTALVMLLPHMPSSIVPHLPTLFNIYARLLFWGQERAGDIEAPGDESDPKITTSASGWETCDFPSESDDSTVPYLISYFTILYGLYPINFMDYIRKPQRYLRHANADADEIEVQPTEIRHKSERFRQSHLLHSNFYTLTIDSEKTDFGRWIKSEPTEVVAECMALCADSSSGGDAQAEVPVPGAVSPPAGDESDRDGPESALLGSSMVPDSWQQSQVSPPSSRVQSAMLRQGSQSSHPSNRDSIDTRNREAGGDSPTLPPHLVPATSQTQLQDMLNSNKAIKSGIHQSMANDSVTSLPLSHPESVPEKLASQPQQPIQPISSQLSVSDLSGQISQLQRQILLLQNDLSFEKYLKQQHMSHIGELRRRQVREQATEAETQNLFMENRNLKKRLEDVKKAEMQIKKESEKSRTLAKKWESDLSTKLKTLREESRKTKAEEDAVRRELQNMKEECEKLRKLLCDAEVKELNSKQATQSIEINTAEIDRLKAEVARLTVAERDHQAKVMEREMAIQSATEAEKRAEILNMKLKAREAELQRTKKHFQSQIVVLNAKLLEAQESGRAKPVADASALKESALAASRAKQAQLQNKYTLLRNKHMALQSSLSDERGLPIQMPPKGDPYILDDSDAEGSPLSLSPVNSRTRPHRVFLDPEMHETSSSFSTTAPLEKKPSSGSSQRPSTPPGTEAPGPGPGLSPEQRYHGRGGVQNRIRKEGKEKRMMGLRGIRGLSDRTG